MPRHVLEQTRSLRALHATLRSVDTNHADFVFHSNRLIHMILERCMELLPYRTQSVRTPVGEIYSGCALDTPLCGVSVVRAGESMEHELRTIMQGVPVGKILIQRDKHTKLPRLFYVELPDHIAECHVLLFEPMLATGGSAVVAVEQLLARGVKEENITFANILASPEGLARLEAGYPALSIVTSSVEQRINPEAYMIPGIGDFGDRYFGTVRKGTAYGQQQ